MLDQMEIGGFGYLTAEWRESRARNLPDLNKLLADWPYYQKSMRRRNQEMNALVIAGHRFDDNSPEYCVLSHGYLRDNIAQFVLPKHTTIDQVHEMAEQERSRKRNLHDHIIDQAHDIPEQGQEERAAKRVMVATDSPSA